MNLISRCPLIAILELHKTKAAAVNNTNQALGKRIAKMRQLEIAIMTIFSVPKKNQLWPNLLPTIKNQWKYPRLKLMVQMLLSIQKLLVKV